MKLKRFLQAGYKILLIVAVFACAIALTENLPISYINMNQYVSSDVTYTDGETVHFDDKNFGEVDKGDIVTLQINMPEQSLLQNPTLVFYDFNAITEVWCEGTLLDSYGEDIAQKGMMIGNHDFCISLPDDVWGKKVFIVVKATENNAFTNFTNIRLYPAEKAYVYYLDNDPIGFAIAITLFVFGIMGLVAFLIGSIRTEIPFNGLYLSLAIFLVALWMIANKGIYNVFQLKFYFWQPLEYMAGYTAVIPMLLFYRGLSGKTSKWKQWFKTAALIMACFSAITTVLNFTNIAHFDTFMNLGSVLIILCCLLMMSYSLQNKTENRKKNQLLRTGTYIFIPTCLYEVLLRSVYRVLPLTFLHNLPSLISIGILFLFAYMAGAFLYDLNEMKQELENSRIKAMINQMKPHFLYNALASIQIIIKRDPDRAYTLLRDFTVHLRGSIKALSSDEPIGFADELTNIRSYLNIEMMRFEDKLHVEYDINCEDFNVTPLTIEPLVENAVKHGIFPRGKEGGTVYIRSYETESDFVVEVEDDGVGFDVSKVMAENRDSYGLKNLIFRAQSLSQAKVDIESIANKGTIVTVRIPRTDS